MDGWWSTVRAQTSYTGFEMLPAPTRFREGQGVYLMLTFVCVSAKSGHCEDAVADGFWRIETRRHYDAESTRPRQFPSLSFSIDEIKSGDFPRYLNNESRIPSASDELAKLLARKKMNVSRLCLRLLNCSFMILWIAYIRISR